MTSAPLSLDRLPLGATARIVSVDGEPAILQRLLEMGLLEGDEIELLAIAPLGDPLEIRRGDFRLSLRRAEAARILVEPVS
ncbi:MAG: FeoA family protein [Gemmataceae bacterium]